MTSRWLSTEHWLP